MSLNFKNIDLKICDSAWNFFKYDTLNPGYLPLPKLHIYYATF